MYRIVSKNIFAGYADSVVSIRMPSWDDERFVEF